MTDFPATSIGFEFEFGKLRIVKGGEPKSVLFSSKDKSDDRHAKLVMVTVDIATGGDATTEVISGPICVTGAKLDKMLDYLRKLHRAVEDCERENAIATRDRVRAKIEGTPPVEAQGNEQEDEQAETKAGLQRLAAEVSAEASSSAVVECPLDGPPPPPPPPAQRPPPGKDEVADGDKPHFVAHEGWFSSVPQVNLGIQIRTVGDARFHTYDFLVANLPGILPSLYQGIVKNLDRYLNPLLPHECPVEAREDAKGAIALYALLAANLAFLGQNDLDTLDNKKVPYKESWGLLPKVKPVELWDAIGGRETLKGYWEKFPNGEAHRFVDTLLPDTEWFPGKVKDPPGRLKDLIGQLAAKTAAKQFWKPAPNAPPPFKIAGRCASVWEMRLSAKATRDMEISAPDGDGAEIFARPDAARKFLQLCANLTEPK